jgi:hypothetical protein
MLGATAAPAEPPEPVGCAKEVMRYCGEFGARQWNRVRDMSEGSRAERPVAARLTAPRPIREARPMCVWGFPFLILPDRSAGIKPGAARRGGDALGISEKFKAPKQFAS